MSKSNAAGGIGFTTVIFLILLFLKLFGLISISWWWIVFLPIILDVAVFIILLLIFFILIFLGIKK